jgi:exodeoxyribonuclease VIII
MLDTETLGTSPGCPVLSIACRAFAIERDGVFTDISGASQAFEAFPSLRLQMRDYSELRIEADTMTWWMKQSEEARSIFLPQMQELSMYFHIDELTRYVFDHSRGSDIIVWARDPDFDCAILDYFYARHAVTMPWRYSNKRSHRTLLALAGVQHKPSENAHNALADVDAQIDSAFTALRVLGKMK